MHPKLLDSLTRLIRYRRHLLNTLVIRREKATRTVMELDARLQAIRQEWMAQIEITAVNPWCSATFKAYRHQWKSRHAELLAAKTAAQQEQTELVTRIGTEYRRLKKLEIIYEKCAAKISVGTAV